MTKMNLHTMSATALLKLRRDIDVILEAKADALRQELQAIAGVQMRKRPGRRKSLKGRLVKPKYQDDAGNSWAGRGVMPRWMSAAIKGGAKRDDFLIEKPSQKAKRTKSKRKYKHRRAR